MKQLSNILFVIILLLFAPSCKDGQTVGVDPKPETPIYELPADVPTTGMTIVLPAGSSADLSSYTVFSQSFTVKPKADGSVEVPYSKDSYNIAWVFDQSHNIVLAGFVTDSDTTLSVATTAEVLLYISMGVTFAPDEVKKTFVSDIGTIEGVAEWKAELENIFVSDPLMLSKGLFIEPLKSVLTSLKGTAPAVLADNKPADVTVNAGDIRSGLQLAEYGLNHFTITNTFRRRAYAFVYKKSYKDMNGGSHIVHSEISGNVAPISVTKISPTKAIRGWKGVLQGWVSAWAAGEELKFASTTAGPIEIPFEDNEMQTKFKVRVVGPGLPSGIPFTDQEKERWWNASAQTLLFDYILPIMLDAMGHNKILGEMNSSLALGKNLERLQNLQDNTKSLIGAIPAVSNALEKGDFKKASQLIVYAIIDGNISKAASQWMKSLYETMGNYVLKNGSNYYTDPSAFDDRIENLTKVLEVIDMGMKLVDYLRISGAIAGSITMEPWDLVAREVQINLEPRSLTLGPNEKQKYTAYIKTDLGKTNPVLQYHWETTGQYGYMTDDRGHEGKKFTSSLNNVNYLVSAAAEDLEKGVSYYDTLSIAITLKKGQEIFEVGTDTAIVEIKKNESKFTVPLEHHIGIREYVDDEGKTFWRFGPPYVTAEFAERPGARAYTTATINKDGSVNRGTTRTVDDLYIKDGIVHISWGIGPIIIYGDVYSEARKEKIKARQEKMLEDYATAIQVTVHY